MRWSRTEESPPAHTDPPSPPAPDWIEHRTGVRSLIRHLLEESVPGGVGWLHTLGSVLLLLLAVQLGSGIVLMLYYVPSPDHAWDSLRFVIDQVALGRVVRNLHAYGASAIVIVATLHLLRVLLQGSYKRPREVTWISGVLLLLVLFAFALTGYLLPWDQRAYWATVVTLNIARATPVVGEALAAVLRGGDVLGAATLSRWYAVHVAVLPMIVLALIAAHLALMRRHGISNPVTKPAGRSRPFFPYHAARDAIMAGVVFAVALAVSSAWDAPLAPVANPADAGYAPRPEWYFLWLFELLKLSPGGWEIVAAHGVPAALVAALLLLPFLDRSPERRPWKRPVVTTASAAVLAGIVTLTVIGVRGDANAGTGRRGWGAQALGGALVASQDACTTCHRDGGVANDWARLRFARDDAWVAAHVFAPTLLAPEFAADADAVALQRSRAVTIWRRAVRSGVPSPDAANSDVGARALLGANCLGCHVLDGEGQGDAPNLSRVGRDRDAAWLAGWIADPLAYEADTDMPGFGERLTASEIRRLADYLSRRR